MAGTLGIVSRARDMKKAAEAALVFVK